MCGICGYIYDSVGAFRPDFIGPMTESLIHRGPDGSYFYTEAESGLALGHCRLKVIDLTEKGRQPMSDQAEEIWITYNGEIYNYIDLRKQLLEKGYEFSSNTDTEVIVNAYREFGEDFIHSLNGDFAFALWDKRKKALFLYRDRVGVRPLYYTYQRGIFAFASEIKSFFSHPAFSPPTLNTRKLPEYFGHLYSYGEECLFDNVIEIQPGHCISYVRGTITDHEYFNFSFDPSVRTMSHSDQVDGFKTLLDDAIQIRLNSDVPLGVYLSGGIDSSFMVARMKEKSTDPIYTYSLGFMEKHYDEFRYSDYVSQKLGTVHTKFRISGADFQDVIEKAIWHYDEPQPHLVSIPQYYLARAAQTRTTVALSGTGGDELLGGYAHYQAAVERSIRNASLKVCPSFAELQEEEKYQSQLPPELIASEFKSCNQKYIVDRLFYDSIVDYRLNLAKHFTDSPYPDFLSKMLYMDFKTHVVDMLNKDDKMNMAWGIEGRFPYLDYRLVQFALSMSPELKISKGTPKMALKQLSRSYFDESFVYRLKQAFPVPALQWLRKIGTRWLDPLKLATLDLENQIDLQQLRHLVSDPESFCRTGSPVRRIWGIYCLERWLHMWFS